MVEKICPNDYNPAGELHNHMSERTSPCGGKKKRVLGMIYAMRGNGGENKNIVIQFMFFVHLVPHIM
jgi:hypothetical protein